MSFTGLIDQPKSAVHLAQFGIRKNFHHNSSFFKITSDTWKIVENEILLFPLSHGSVVQPDGDWRQASGHKYGSLCETYFFMYTHEFSKEMKVAIKASNLVNFAAQFALKGMTFGVNDPEVGSAGMGDFMAKILGEGLSSSMGGTGLGPDGNAVGNAVTNAIDQPSFQSGVGAAYSVTYHTDALISAIDPHGGGGDWIRVFASKAGPDRRKAIKRLSQELQVIFKGKYRVIAIQQKTPIKSSIVGSSEQWTASDSSEISLGESSFALGKMVGGEGECSTSARNGYVAYPWAEKGYVPGDRHVIRPNASFRFLRTSNQVELGPRPNLESLPTNYRWNPIVWRVDTAKYAFPDPSTVLHLQAHTSNKLHLETRYGKRVRKIQ